jgi:tetrahydromethanopterin S-methyltransferase subunit H
VLQVRGYGVTAGQGLFWVDAYTDAGSITVASADTSTGVVGQLASSDFFTYGPVSDSQHSMI